jgi:hypothetical protein
VTVTKRNQLLVVVWEVGDRIGRVDADVLGCATAEGTFGGAQVGALDMVQHVEARRRDGRRDELH